MRILVAPDKFKGSLGAAEVAGSIAAGLRTALPAAEIAEMPVADGGEGTAALICSAHGSVVGAGYGVIANGAVAVLEVAEVCGLARIPAERRDPLNANSFGVGELLLAAAAQDIQQVIVGLGGSATNDGGYGLARALGFRFLDARQQTLPPCVSGLLQLERIEPPARLLLPRIVAAADVANPLLGPRGATRVFGPQKGAGPEQIEVLEAALQRLADVVARDLGRDFRDSPRAGAAGGLGFGLMSFCGAEVRSGFDVVAEAIGLKSAVQNADVIITGEGRLDSQTLEGKAPAGVARLARKHGKPVHAIVGECSETAAVSELFNSISILRASGISRAAAMEAAAELLRDCGRKLGEQLRA